jgi:CheY-like chemotaxis protein
MRRRSEVARHASVPVRSTLGWITDFLFQQRNLSGICQFSSIAWKRGNASVVDEGAPLGAGKTVLVAEDEVLVRHDISEYMRSRGFNVVEANSAAEAIQVLKDSLEVSVVFTDVRMPGTADGIDLARYVKKHHPQIPVIITSGHIFSAELPKDLGRLIDKPYDRALVVQAIVEALSKPTGS